MIKDQMPGDGAGRPMKVCIAVPWDQEFGGVASVVGNLAKYLESRGSEAYFAHPEGTNRLTPKRTKWGFPGFALRMRGPFDAAEPARSAAAFLAHCPGTLIQMRAFLRRHAVGVVNVHYPIDAFVYFAILKALGSAKLVVSIHGTDLFPRGQRSERYSRAMRMLLRSADRIVTPSRAFLDDFVGVFPEHEGKATFIHNGIDLAGLAPPDTPDPEPRGSYLLCIADYNVKKGLDVLLRAFAGLEERRRGLRLLLAGDGPLRADLESLVRELGLTGQAVLMGRRPRPEIVRLLHGCELLVLPSRSEPFGIALIEAMACRKPVVAAAVGGIREIVTSGEDGLLVPPEEPGTLAAAIGSVLRDRALGKRLGERARETVARRFTFETTGSAYAKLYEDVISAGRAASSRLSASAEA